MPIVQVDNVKKVYPNGTRALQGVTFSIQKGETVIVLGHNGSGKSTLLRSMTMFERPTEGDIHIFGESVLTWSKRKLREARRNIGMVFQTFHLVHNISVFQNVLFGALGRVRYSFQTFNLFASDALRRKAMNCLERVGLSHVAQRRADELSGGQKQRVAIARMLMQDPEIILADEPIASLDPKAGKEIMDLLWSIAEEKNITLIVILHQIEMAKAYGDRVIALKKGQIVMDEAKEDIDNNYLDHIYDESIDNVVSITQEKSSYSAAVGGK